MSTVQELLYDARALLDEYNEDGVIIAPADVSSLETNGIRFINMGLQEIYSKTRTYETYNITRKPATNLLGGIGVYMDLMEFLGEPIPTTSGIGAKSYYFEVDNDAIVKIQEFTGSWVDLVTIDTTGTTELTPFKGLITPSSVLNEVRILFDGSTYYQFKNVALYKAPYKLEDIPEYRPWVKYELPENFGELNKVVIEFPTRQYAIDNHYKWEGYKSFYVNWFFDGEIRVIYNPIPVFLANKTDSVPINNPTSRQFLVYYVAAKMAFTENPQIANFLEQKSNELKFEATKGQPSAEQKITDVYFTNGG